MAFFARLKEGLKGVKERWSGGIARLFTGSSFDAAFWEELEDRLIAGDVGLELSEEIVASLKEEVRKSGITSPEALKDVFVGKVASELNAVPGMGQPFPITPSPQILLMIGVNGSGKTTSAGKLALQYKQQGKSVILAAADTFRAAAVDQLKIWGDRTGVRVVAQGQGSDPAAVAFDAWQAAKSAGADLLIVDTAGRLHDKHNLMEELRKIHRVLLREAGEERLQTVLVLDAVLGQNSVAQAETFNTILPISSVILTKYDNTAKGGVVLSIARRLRVPVRCIGLGEAPEDLSPFDTMEFARALMEGEAR
ncbi:MAG: signal recognition particle-docking protein FtsY [Fretibacterium sp.]|nr:signal recognition particle-docking protein FtsY [Fretibacterium sp.]